MDRNLDGVFFRVERDGKWRNVCFSDLTEGQMRDVLKGRDADWLRSMCVVLGQCIRDIGDQCDVVRRDGE